MPLFLPAVSELTRLLSEPQPVRSLMANLPAIGPPLSGLNAASVDFRVMSDGVLVWQVAPPASLTPKSVTAGNLIVTLELDVSTPLLSVPVVLPTDANSSFAA